MEKIIANWLLVIKGDVEGHEFHGNQWTTVGNINHDVATFLATNADKFYKAGGMTKTYEADLSGTHPDTAIPQEAQERLRSEDEAIYRQLMLAAPEDKDQFRRLAMGYERMNSALKDIAKGQPGIIAYDKDGHIASVITLGIGKGLSSGKKFVRVLELGSTNKVPGSATALEIEAARYAASKGMALKGDYTGNSKGFHQLIGRTLDELHQGSSEWTAKECQAIATLSRHS